MDAHWVSIIAPQLSQSTRMVGGKERGMVKMLAMSVVVDVELREELSCNHTHISSLL